MDPINQSTLKTKGKGKFGLNEVAHREGKRKVATKLSPFEAQMANVVQSIANRVNHTNQSPSKPHVENNNPKAESSLSIRDKKRNCKE